jgi:hypothetical protein
MSWYVANANKILDQFASGRGYSDLIHAAEDYPSLTAFFETGSTANVVDCVKELETIVRDHKTPGDVRLTAKGLAEIIRGQEIAVITQGFTG